MNMKRVHVVLTLALATLLLGASAAFAVDPTAAEITSGVATGGKTEWLSGIDGSKAVIGAVMGIALAINFVIGKVRRVGR
jgi:hypothetical protein